ncbi:hypothetical protein Y032_0036g3272 [Ancylostoma ceylanicum]|uniref:Uncharacterized protein n=1 Tax=Ancylostoma ceylanicum TaxID=53326 RepID=A0A016UMB2_9BILA|nr:hypothetical protein Y032_0036g3272 [Ancylostoma ceylanicum]
MEHFILADISTSRRLQRPESGARDYPETSLNLRLSRFLLYLYLCRKYTCYYNILRGPCVSSSLHFIARR